MAKMMPGRVRAQGIELYETGKLFVEEIAGDRLRLHIDGEAFVYSPRDEEVSCSCDVFEQRGYCPHLAAAEYFLRHDPQGRSAAEKMLEKGKEERVLNEKLRRGSQFLESVAPVEQVGTYALTVEGQLLLYDDNIEWFLSIRRLPEQKSYVIRDIGVFLKAVKERGEFQIGKQYREQLSYEQFDLDSQAVLEMLLVLESDGSRVSRTGLGDWRRSVRLPKAWFIEGVQRFLALSGSQFRVGFQVYDELVVRDLTAAVGLYDFEVEVEQELMRLHIKERKIRSLLSGAYFLENQVLYQTTPAQQRLLASIAVLPEENPHHRVVEFELADQHRLALSLVELATVGQVSAPKAFEIRSFKPAFHLDTGRNGQVTLDVTLDFSGYLVRSVGELEQLPFAIHEGQVAQVFTTVEELGFTGGFSAAKQVTPEALYAFFDETIPHLKLVGQVTVSERLAHLRLDARPHLSLSGNGSLLEIDFAFDGIAEDEIEEALTALLEQASHYVSRAGQVLVFDEESKRISQTLQTLRLKQGKAGRRQLHRLHALHLAQEWSDNSLVELDETLRQMVEDLSRPDRLESPEYQVTSTLRDYQVTGVKWLSALHRHGFGGILADDMGLGKTLQTIAFLTAHLRERQRVLILAPSSLLYNWQEECRRFAPQLDVLVVHGTKAERTERLARGSQIVVTSYPAFRQDIELYHAEQFDFLFLDEAQVMKNAQTKIAQHLRNFEVKHCFALSGTPIENHLNEIWSIFQIILPGLLPSKRAFQQLSAEQVARRIAPFVLRRRKEEVLEELPALMEMTTLSELTDEQKALYLAQLQQMQASIAQSSDAEIQSQKMEILAGITRLRQICDTPRLFMEEYAGDSGKIESLRQLLSQLKEGGHRVLIFSQFRKMLELIEQEVADLGMTSYTLTGSTPIVQRQEMTKAFNLGSRDAFLVSLKAGGVGLNLTGADTVILVDLWWNPAVEAQAVSRAHRMGQTETVECYRLITRGTIEEKILALQESKKDLVTTVLDGDEHRASLSVEEIREILGIS